MKEREREKKGGRERGGENITYKMKLLKQVNMVQKSAKTNCVSGGNVELDLRSMSLTGVSC